jgi:hypothetical protein
VGIESARAKKVSGKLTLDVVTAEGPGCVPPDDDAATRLGIKKLKVLHLVDFS